MSSQKVLKQQLRELMNIPENAVCLDCKDKRPTWASLIVPPPGSSFDEPIGCFCCYHCSGAHRRMGTHICFVRSTNLDEWKEKELRAMRIGGNKLVNAIFEANLNDRSVKPDKHTELEERSEFIYKKYQHREWYDPAAGFSSVGLNETLPEEDFFANGGEGSDFADWGEVKFPSLDEIKTDSPKKSSGASCPFGSFSGDRTNLISTLERMESKSNVLDDINHLDAGPDVSSPTVKPRRISAVQPKKKKKKKKENKGLSRSSSHSETK
eukprot:scaffold22568_cov125-Cylindrotheca_fusiformis.AAC.12